jgi:hypothetical protein
MNYQRIYDQIIDRARDRELDCYREKHHVTPKCLGGSDSKSNLVELTAREHFICHWLLSRLYPEEPKLSYAFWMMSTSKRPNRYRPSSRTYEEAKQLQSTLRSLQLLGHITSEETRKKISKSNRGKKRTEEERKKMSDAQKGKIGTWNGRTHSEESKQKMREKKLGNKASDETKKRMSESRKGQTRTEEQKKKYSKAMKGIPKKKYECQNCKRLIGGMHNLERHLLSCKKK